LSALIVAVGGGACGGNAFSAGAPDASAEASLLDGVTGDGDASDSATSGNIVYVSTATGDDSNPGTTSKAPKKTIVSALTEAGKLGVGAEVHVCAGNYAESSLVVTQDVKLLGGYDCLLWKRTATYGWPTFDAKNESIITNAAPTAEAATVTFMTASVTSATALDGFAISGASGTVGTSYGIDVQGPASPLINNNVVTGASNNTAPMGPYGSVGIRVGGSSTAEVALNAATGGGGEGAIGSVGIVVISTGLAWVHDDLVTGGTGSTTGATPALAAVGVAVLAAPTVPKPLTGLIVSGTDTGGAAGKSVGIFVSGLGVAATLGGCDVQGGTGLASSTSSAGIDLETTGSVGIQACRIFGGTRKGGSSQTFGVHVGGVASLAIFDSEIHAGEVTGGTTNASAIGVALEAGNAPALVDDTIYTGTASGSAAIQVGPGVAGTVVSGDILLGGGSSSSDVALLADKCSGTFASIDHSAVVNFPVLYECSSPAPQIATDPSGLAGELGSTVVSPTNVEYAGACTGAMAWCVADPSCPSTPATACAQSIFGSTFTSADDGVTGMFDGPPAADGGTTPGAWSLAPGVSCALAHNGVVNASIPTDIFGTTRGNTPSMGAVQYTQNAPCTQ
jgi:hypothetical protein